MNGNVMIVDDDADIRFFVRTVLESAGCNVSDAPDAASLRQALKVQPPDALVLDLQLPDGNGVELLREVKQSWPKTKVIILTGYGTVEAAESVYKIDNVYLQSKPFDGEMLTAMLDMALAEPRKERHHTPAFHPTQRKVTEHQGAAQSLG
jgi:DNA-binding NtrC family response regulator